MRRGETLDELDAFVSHLDDYADVYGFEAGAVVVAAVCVDAERDHVARAAVRWPHVRHYWCDEKAIRDLEISRVPSRVIVDDDAVVRRVWDGTHGKVLHGRHGASLKNGSHTLLRELADIIHGARDDDPH